MDRHGIAQRIRGLISLQDDGDLARIARQLRIEEVSLSMSIDDFAPYPTEEVLAAVLRHYAVDPAWLLTGEYSTATHTLALASDELSTSRGARRLMESLATRPILRSSAPGMPIVRVAELE